MMNTQNPWKVILPLCAVLVIDGMTIGVVFPELAPMFLNPKTAILPAHTSELMRHLYYGLSLSLPSLLMFFGAPILGDLSDRFGRKRVLIAGLFGVALSCFASAYGIAVVSMFAFLIGRALVGFADGGEALAQAAMADISQPKDKARNMAFISSAGAVGFIFGPAAGGFLSNTQLVSWFNFGTPFEIAGILALLNAIALIFTFKETFVPREVKKWSWSANLQNLKQAFSDPRVRGLALLFLFGQTAWALCFQSITILLMKTFHYGPEMIGIYMTAIAVFFIVALLVLVPLLNKYCQRSHIILGTLVSIMLGNILLAIPTHHAWLAWVAILFPTLGGGLIYNTAMAMLSDLEDDQHQGRMMGIGIALLSVAWLTSGLASGFLSEINLYLPYLVAAAIAACTFIYGIKMKSVDTSAPSA